MDETWKNRIFDCAWLISSVGLYLMGVILFAISLHEQLVRRITTNGKVIPLMWSLLVTIMAAGAVVNVILYRLSETTKNGISRSTLLDLSQTTRIMGIAGAVLFFIVATVSTTVLFECKTCESDCIWTSIGYFIAGLIGLVVNQVSAPRVSTLHYLANTWDEQNQSSQVMREPSGYFKKPPSGDLEFTSRPKGGFKG